MMVVPIQKTMLYFAIKEAKIVYYVYQNLIKLRSSKSFKAASYVINLLVV